MRSTTSPLSSGMPFFFALNSENVLAFLHRLAVRTQADVFRIWSLTSYLTLTLSPGRFQASCGFACSRQHEKLSCQRGWCLMGMANSNFCPLKHGHIPLLDYLFAHYSAARLLRRENRRSTPPNFEVNICRSLSPDF